MNSNSFAKLSAITVFALAAALSGCATIQTAPPSRAAPAPQSENKCLVYGRVLFGNMPGAWTAQVVLRSSSLFSPTYTIWCDTDGLYWLPNARQAKTWSILKAKAYRNGQWFRDIDFPVSQTGSASSRIEQMPTLILDFPPDTPPRVSLSSSEALRQDALRAALLNTRLVAWHALIRLEAGL